MVNAAGQASGQTRLRVLMVASWFPSAEAPLSGIFIREQAIELAKHVDLAVLYVHLTARDGDIQTHYEDGFLAVVAPSRVVSVTGAHPVGRLRDLDSRTWHPVRVAKRALRVVEAAGWGPPDVVHAQVLYPGGIIARALAHRYGVPFVVTEHSSEFMPGNESFLQRNRSVRWLIRRAARDAAFVMPVSSGLERAVRRCGVEARFTVVPNMVRDDGPLVPADEIDYRQAVHVSLMWDRAKNVSGLLKACAELLDEGEPPFRLRIVGDGPDRDRLERLAADLGLVPHTVTFEGRLARDETLQLIAHSGFLVTPSRFETFSIATAEALMCGRPVIATRSGGPEDYVIPEVGILIEPDDPQGLKGALREMLGTASAYDAEAIARHARQTFSPVCVARRIVEIYREALSPEAGLAASGTDR